MISHVGLCFFWCCFCLAWVGEYCLCCLCNGRRPNWKRKCTHKGKNSKSFFIPALLLLAVVATVLAHPAGTSSAKNQTRCHPVARRSNTNSSRQACRVGRP